MQRRVVTKSNALGRDAMTDVIDSQSDDSLPYRRKHERKQVSWNGQCSRNSSESCDIEVVDASEGGLGLRGMTLNVSVGDYINVYLEEIGLFQCKVAWKHELQCGVEILSNEPGFLDDEQIHSVGSFLRRIAN